MSTVRYTLEDIQDALRAVGVREGGIVFVTSDLGRVPGFEQPSKATILNAYLQALHDVIGPRGTIVVPTASLYLCNTDIPFNLAETPSQNVGVFSEFVRKQPGALRSFHPFVSYTALGAAARDIIESVSRHSYGPNTPEERLVEMGARSVSIGLYPRYSGSTLHQAEAAALVPYRYVKEYLHPIDHNGRIVREQFYQYVIYLDSGVERNFGEHIYPMLEAKGAIASKTIGERGKIYGYDTAGLFDVAKNLLLEDPYAWCKNPPSIRPWQK